MNSPTRRLVYSSIFLGALTLCAYADPIGAASSDEPGTLGHASLSATGTLALAGAGDVTLSSFSEGERLAVRGSFSNASHGYLATEIVMLTPATGKVQTFDGSSRTQQGTAMHAAADNAATDSGAVTSSDSSSTAATDTGSEVVSEASADISDEVGSDNMSVATTSSDSVATTTSSDNPFDPVETSGAPEPSNILLGGSMFVAWGLAAAVKRYRA